MKSAFLFRQNRSNRRFGSWALCTSLLFLLFGFVSHCYAQSLNKKPTPGVRKQRLIVLTDIGAEADDTESTVRLLLYSDVIDIQGLIATTSTWKRTTVAPELIREVVVAYGKVSGNLLQHDADYPSVASLRVITIVP